jgi:hypothetical protein
MCSHFFDLFSNPHCSKPRSSEESMMKIPTF